MKVKLNDRILSGARTYAAGETADLPKDEALALCDRGLARRFTGRGKGSGDDAGSPESPQQEDPIPEYEPQIADDDTHERE
ncbi:MAG TPA: hypothetical protein PLU44_16855 [Candidatus Krumholzibacteria bacterium]|nr:hypothetical protein [Candidatus Krumholzibacteria bacterium]